MTTVINNPTPVVTSESDTGFGNGIFVGLILFIGLIILLVYFGIPALRKIGSADLSVPAPQVNVPSEIDVNVTQPN